jgi:hypothetical protein
MGSEEYRRKYLIIQKRIFGMNIRLSQNKQKKIFENTEEN